MLAFVEALRREHGSIIGELLALSRGIDAPRRGEPAPYPELVRIMERLCDLRDRHHHPREERLFDRLARRLNETPPLVTRLQREHTKLTSEGQELLGLLRQACEDAHQCHEALAARCHAFIRDQRWHINQEETGLYRLAQSTLGKADWEALESESRHRSNDQCREDDDV